MTTKDVDNYASQLTDLARQLNAFASDIKVQRRGKQGSSKTVREESPEYIADWIDDSSMRFFADEELEWLQTVPNI
ncbi:MAG: hypothetical protein H8D37_03205 [Chloroflexi bacterium]|nr:hypothetical protein [Chloroflexota bacterium]